MNKSDIYISEKVKNASNVTINPATSENQDEAITALNSISQKKIWDSFWLKNVLSAITRLTVDASGQLRAVVGDKMTIIRSPDGYQAIYQLLHTSNAFVRDFSISVL